MRFFLYAFNSLLALLLTLLAAAAVIIIVGDAVVELWGDDRPFLAILALIGFPIAFVIWPWTHEAFGLPLWPLFIAALIAFKMASYWAEHGEASARRDLESRY